MSDPWSRPTIRDLQSILESIEKVNDDESREVERLELSVPAEVRTLRGNVISAMTREVSRTGLGLVHRGPVTPGEVTVTMASETRQFDYRVQIEWCTPCDNGMFISGGRFIRKGLEE